MATTSQLPALRKLSDNSWIDRSWFYDARAIAHPRERNSFYHQQVRKHYLHLVPPGMRALEMGCGTGDLLAAVKPRSGVGVDFSSKVINLAHRRHPELEFNVDNADHWSCSEPFDYILMSDLINDLRDVQGTLEHLRTMTHAGSRLVINFHSNLWRPALALGEKLGAKSPSLLQNWLSTADVKNLLHLAGWEAIRVQRRILFPLGIPLLSSLFNRWLAPILSHLCLTIFIVARPKPKAAAEAHHHCSVIIPVRNEAGNIEGALKRTPEMGLGTELIFIEGHSRDNSWDEINRVAKANPQRKIKVLRQTGKGKGNAVREAFAAASGDVLFILDADLTVPPEELPKFYELVRSGSADFVNGVRLVYPMEHEAMRFLNMIANKIFGLSFGWLLGQPLKDTLCGTKVLFRKDYDLIARDRKYFGDFDPFGDFDLLFGAAKLNLKILDLPIRYAARTYGQTNIQRWRHGWLLLHMVIFAARRLKFL